MDKQRQMKDFLGNGYRDKKVLLITLDSPFLDNSLVFPYLGILYLTAAAERLGVTVSYVNNFNISLIEDKLDRSSVFYTDEFDINNIDRYKNIDLAAISCLTPQAPQAYAIRKSFKQKYPDIKVMIGGPHTKGYLEECIKEQFDIICLGDGERIFEAILTRNIECLSKLLHPFSSSLSLVFHDKLSEEEMNFFPIPLRNKEYINRYKYILGDRVVTTMVNSRGCCMGCEFCEDRFTGSRWFSPSHFDAEIRDIISLGIDGVMIFDDLFALDAKKVEPYLDILKKYYYKNGFIFRCFGHSRTMAMYPQMVRMFADSGCVELGFGAESASQDILDRVGKGTKVEELHNFVNLCVKEGINVKAFFMIGLPGETKETFKYTYNFIKKYRTLYQDRFDFDLAVFFPYKGTKIGRIVRLAEGEKIIIDNREYTRAEILLRPVCGLSWQEIDKGKFGAYKKKGGASDIVIESYDWQKKKVLLSAEEIYRLKEETMLLSGRYTDKCGKRIFSPLVEGNINSIGHKDFVEIK